MGVGGPVGVLGGAFDPPHCGHVALAEEAIRHFGLDRLLVCVVADPGHKSVATAAPIRLRLAQLAFARLPEAEVELDAFARTVDSLEALGLADPIFLVGADELLQLGSWKEPERVLELARLGVATRPGYARAALEDVLASASRPERIEIFAIQPIDVSSTGVRALLARAQPVAGLVPAAVGEEITRLGLYRNA